MMEKRALSSEISFTVERSEFHESVTKNARVPKISRLPTRMFPEQRRSDGNIKSVFPAGVVAADDRARNAQPPTSDPLEEFVRQMLRMTSR